MKYVAPLFVTEGILRGCGSPEGHCFLFCFVFHSNPLLFALLGETLCKGDPPCLPLLAEGAVGGAERPSEKLVLTIREVREEAGGELALAGFLRAEIWWECGVDEEEPSQRSGSRSPEERRWEEGRSAL